MAKYIKGYLEVQLKSAGWYVGRNDAGRYYQIISLASCWYKSLVTIACELISKWTVIGYSPAR